MKILELLTSGKCWCKNDLAKTKRGEATMPYHHDAAQWCLIGAIERCYPNDYYTTHHKIEEAIVECYPEAEFDNYDLVVQFNNAKSTTFRKIRRVLRKANV